MDIKKNYKPYVNDVEFCQKRISVLEIIGSSTRGGMENQISHFIKNLPANQYTLTCICPCESLFTKTLRELGVEGIFITPIADNPEWRSIQLAIEVARQYQVDVIHAHMPKSHVLAGLAGSVLQKPVVATLHGMHVTSYELGVALTFKSHLITNCQESYIQALALGVPAERVNLFHNGVDIENFTPAKSGNDLRDLINVPVGSTLVGFVGRLEHEKGPDNFLRAAGRIHEMEPDIHFAIVGDGSMLKKLEKMSRQLQLEQHLHFIPWITDTSNVYPAFDVVAHTSRSDGTSLVVLEAMASGRPVIGMSVGGLREMIENEHTGMLSEPNDWEGFANQVVELLRQPKLLKMMGERARTRAEQYFSVFTNTQLTANLLRKVAGLSDTKKEYPNNNKVLHALEVPDP